MTTPKVFKVTPTRNKHRFISLASSCGKGNFLRMWSADSDQKFINASYIKDGVYAELRLSEEVHYVYLETESQDESFVYSNEDTASFQSDPTIDTSKVLDNILKSFCQ